MNSEVSFVEIILNNRDRAWVPSTECSDVILVLCCETDLMPLVIVILSLMLIFIHQNGRNTYNKEKKYSNNTDNLNCKQYRTY